MTLLLQQIEADKKCPSPIDWDTRSKSEFSCIVQNLVRVRIESYLGSPVGALGKLGLTLGIPLGMLGIPLGVETPLGIDVGTLGKPVLEGGTLGSGAGFVIAPSTDGSGLTLELGGDISGLVIGLFGIGASTPDGIPVSG